MSSARSGLPSSELVEIAHSQAIPGSTDAEDGELTTLVTGSEAIGEDVAVEYGAEQVGLT